MARRPGRVEDHPAGDDAAASEKANHVAVTVHIVRQIEQEHATEAVEQGRRAGEITDNRFRRQRSHLQLLVNDDHHRPRHDHGEKRQQIESPNGPEEPSQCG